MTRNLLAACVALVLASPAHSAILMRPYLQALTPTSVYVLVETDSPVDIVVEYGTNPDCSFSAKTESVALTSDSPVTYVHRIALRDLAPETGYFYRAGEGGAYSETSSFRTGALPGTPFRFAWVADDRNGPDVFDSVIVRAAAMHPLLALYGGDLCPRPAYGDWKSGFFRDPQIEFGASVPWINTPGNHEKWTVNTKAFTHGPVGAASEEYSSFDCGDMHVLLLNTEVPVGSGTPQYAFAENDLRTTNRKWKIVMTHRSAYCAGGHGEDSTLIAMSAAMFEKYGVDMVLSGHSHFYQHNLVNGIHHMIIGSAGAPLYDPANFWYTQKSLKEYCWAVADVTAGSFALHVYNERGALLDTITLNK